MQQTKYSTQKDRTRTVNIEQDLLLNRNLSTEVCFLLLFFLFKKKIGIGYHPHSPLQKTIKSMMTQP